MAAVSRPAGDVVALLRAEGMVVTQWEDDPGMSYGAHAHPHREVRVVMRGQITFTVGAETIVAGPGDRVDFEPGERHAARVGPQGATYIAGTAR